MAIYPKEGLAEDVGLKTLPAIYPQLYPSFTLAYNVRSEAAVNKIIEETRTIGAKIIKEPQKVFWGGYSGYSSDPEGYFLGGSF